MLVCFLLCTDEGIYLQAPSASLKAGSAVRRKALARALTSANSYNEDHDWTNERISRCRLTIISAMHADTVLRGVRRCPML
jgi:hypothetical protein